MAPSSTTVPSQAPSETPTSAPPPSDFLADHWEAFAFSGIGLVMLLGIILIIIVVRRWRQHSSAADVGQRLLREKPSGSKHNKHPPVTSPGSRYQNLAPLRNIYGQESETTYLVRKKSDNEQYTVKYVPCSGDRERLNAMSEFESLRVFHGHPNMVNLIDMFMHYSFSTPDQTRIVSPDTQRSLDRTTESGFLREKAPVSSSTYGSAASIALLTQVTINTGSLKDPAAAPMSSNNSKNDVPRDSSDRYVGIVMEYYPLGSIAQWCVTTSLEQTGKRWQKEYFPTGDNICLLPPAPESILLAVVAQVSAFLRYLHFELDIPFAHKGVKPENILVTACPSPNLSFIPVVLSDFGFSEIGTFAPPKFPDTTRDPSYTQSMLSGTSSNTEGRSKRLVSQTKSDMWMLGCTLLSLATYKFGRDFPAIGEALDMKHDKPHSINRIYAEISAEVRKRGYSKELATLTVALLHYDETLRPSSELVSRMFARQSDGRLVLSIR